MNSYCCVICDSGLEKSSLEAVQLLRWNQVKVASILEDPNSEVMKKVKESLTGKDFRKLMTSAKNYAELNQHDNFALCYHDRYGQCENLELNGLNSGADAFKATGSVKLGQVLEVIARDHDESWMRDFLRKCANESVKVAPELATSSVDHVGSFDSAIYISLGLESYLVIRGISNGTMVEQWDLPYDGSDKASLFSRVGSVLLNENGYRAIVIDNIIGIGVGKEKEELADPYEWIRFIQGFTTLCDKYLIIGMLVPGQEMTDYKLYEECDAGQLGDMLNCLKDQDNVKMLNFAGGYAAVVQDV